MRHGVVSALLQAQGERNPVLWLRLLSLAVWTARVFQGGYWDSMRQHQEETERPERLRTDGVER